MTLNFRRAGRATHLSNFVSGSAYAKHISAALLLATLSLSGCEDEPVAPAVAVPQLPATGCDAKNQRISEIQGEGPQSPLLGKIVSIQAVVTFAATKELGGLFVQEEREDRDGELETSEAMFISADSGQDAKSGDVVRVTGTVVELGDAGKSMTALNALSEFRVCGTGKLPSEASVEQAPLIVADWERYEAMRVHLDVPLTVLANYNLRRHGELLVSLNGRQYSPTELNLPGQDALKVGEDNLRQRLILDDANLMQFPKQISYLSTPLSPEAPYRSGTRLGEVRGILDERVNFRLHVLSKLVAEQAVRPRLPPEAKGSLRVVSFNMLNWFNGDGKGKGFENSRGATTPAQALDQRSKLIAALAALKPDIAGLMEVENDGDEKLNALTEFVQALNRQTGLGYQIVASPKPKLGTDQIKVALIYRAKTVQLAGTSAALETPPFDYFNRPPLAQSFQQRSNGGTFTVVVNHFKSKGCNEADASNQDRGDGQACYNPKRVEAAKALIEWLKTDPTGSGDADQLLLGDFNAYSQEDPMRIFREAGFMQLGQGKDPHYSFVYNGDSGSLDHALASESLKTQVLSAKPWHINADEYPGFDYLSDAQAGSEAAPLSDEQKKANAQARLQLFRRTAFRSSDHDPLLLGLDLEAETKPQAGERAPGKNAP